MPFLQKFVKMFQWMDPEKIRYEVIPVGMEVNGI